MANCEGLRTRRHRAILCCALVSETVRDVRHLRSNHYCEHSNPEQSPGLARQLPLERHIEALTRHCCRSCGEEQCWRAGSDGKTRGFELDSSADHEGFKD